MSDLQVRLHPMFSGAKFRPVSWHEFTEDGAVLIGYGVEAKGKTDRRYKLAAVDGESIPFRNKKDAAKWCRAANKRSLAMLEES